MRSNNNIMFFLSVVLTLALALGVIYFVVAYMQHMDALVKTLGTVLP